jgi:hypothetical protein
MVDDAMRRQAARLRGSINIDLLGSKAKGEGDSSVGEAGLAVKLKQLTLSDFSGGSSSGAGADPLDGGVNSGHAVEEHAEDVFVELDNIVGHANVKKLLRGLHATVMVQEARRTLKIAGNGLADSSNVAVDGSGAYGAGQQALHMVFQGNPGTGKTTVAQLVARLLRNMGVLKHGQLVQVKRGDLVAGYVGQTAIKTEEVVQSALGGVLFVDEAYALVQDSANGDAFGEEALTVLLDCMEQHREGILYTLSYAPLICSPHTLSHTLSHTHTHPPSYPPSYTLSYTPSYTHRKISWSFSLATMGPWRGYSTSTPACAVASRT